MDRLLLRTVAFCAIAAPLCAAAEDPEDSTPGITLGADEYLSAGAEAIRVGQYDDGIRYTLLGLEHMLSSRNRAAGLANLCAAYVAKNQPDDAIPYCTEALTLSTGNWRIYSTRARAYFLKGEYTQAAADNDKAAELSPNSAHVQMMKGLLNERLLKPQVIMEEHH